MAQCTAAPTPPLNAREHPHMQPHMGAHVGELLLGSVSGQCAEGRSSNPEQSSLTTPHLSLVWKKTSFVDTKGGKVRWQTCFYPGNSDGARVRSRGWCEHWRTSVCRALIRSKPTHPLDLLPLSAANNIQATNDHGETNRSRNADSLWQRNWISGCPWWRCRNPGGWRPLPVYNSRGAGRIELWGY